MGDVSPVRRTSPFAAAAAIAVTLAGAGCSTSGSPGKAVVTTAASVPFPVAAGNTWKYKLTGSSGAGSETETMTSVVPVAGGKKATMTETDTIAGTTLKSRLVYFFQANGTITCVLLLPGKGNTATANLSYPRFPPEAVISSGKLVELDEQVTAHGTYRSVKEMMHITIRGEGTATVTVPAGTYRAVVVSETSTLTGPGIRQPQTTYVKTWLAPGVGPVQIRVIIGTTDGNRSSQTVLESFKEG